MERVTKVFFDPLAGTKEQIRAILENLPEGSAHPYALNTERILLCRTATGIEEIDISSYPEEYFFNAVDLGELGETLLKRMASFKSSIGLFDEYAIQQAPSATFKIPIVSDQITILAVSERNPTYYDFCLADASYNTCCYTAENTFTGVKHSGDINRGSALLHYVKITDRMTEKELAVFVSGYQYTELTKFRASNPVVLIANHDEKILYIIPVPLDAATIGDATICCPMVIKRDGASIICSVLPNPTKESQKMCSGSTLKCEAFKEAIQRADFTLSAAPSAQPAIEGAHPSTISGKEETPLRAPTKPNAVFATKNAVLPSVIDQNTTQVVQFGTGIEFKAEDTSTDSTTVILPCVFGSRLEGPVLLATGAVPVNVPFSDGNSLRKYYEECKGVSVVVNDQMTDNARNLAGPFRINALFIVKPSGKEGPKTKDISSFMDSININAVTALAGPQSLVVVQVSRKYYFYRGIANRKYLNTSELSFGEDITDVLEATGVESIVEPRVKRLVNLEEANTVILPTSGRMVQPQDLKSLFEELPVDQIPELQEDIAAAVPQLQTLLNQTELQELSKALIAALSTKVNSATEPLRNAYIQFLTKEYDSTNPEHVKKKGDMLGKLKKQSKTLQKALETAISSMANMVSSQTTSKRTHDLNRLLRQTTIQNNVEAVKSMNFEKLAGLLETHAADMGVMVMNIESTPYRELLETLGDKSVCLDADSCCELESRVLHLEGFDAGIIMEQSQSAHDGPLTHQLGPTHPILAMPYLNQSRGSGSMLAWVCWDEFVDLKNPFMVRWMEKCKYVDSQNIYLLTHPARGLMFFLNDLKPPRHSKRAIELVASVWKCPVEAMLTPRTRSDSHIAALRIMMRDTLSKSVASRKHMFQSSSPEIGQLMSALLMSAMTKLAAMRTTLPAVESKAGDTITKLMRGLFGNLLTVAGSGVRPLSMVWQLFGKYPKFDLPSTFRDWDWYEHVVALYPYTGWPLQQFHENLEKLLDRAIVRVITKHENVKEIKAGRSFDLAYYCKLRNIELEHSRTIVTIFKRMLTEDVDRKAVAKRLLESLPKKLERQSKSYTKMLKYVEHLAGNGERIPFDDLVIASVYTRRSAAFGELKRGAASACASQNGAEVKKWCQKIIDKHAEIAAFWNVSPSVLKTQNMEAYTWILNREIGAEIDGVTKKLFDKVVGDAERERVPWQVGKKGEFGVDIERLDEKFVHDIMTGEDQHAIMENAEETGDLVIDLNEKVPELGLEQFSSVLPQHFIAEMEKALSPADVCEIMGVPSKAMHVFAKTLNPNFVWDDLGQNFKFVILALMKERSDREESFPARQLLNLGKVEGVKDVKCIE